MDNNVKTCQGTGEQPGGEAGELRREDVLHKICEILVVSQFKYWVDDEPQTAEEVNTQNGRAIEFYQGKIPDEKSMEANVFHNKIQAQLGYITKILQELFARIDQLEAGLREVEKVLDTIFAIADNDEPNDEESGLGGFSRIKNLAAQALAKIKELLGAKDGKAEP